MPISNLHAHSSQSHAHHGAARSVWALAQGGAHLRFSQTATMESTFEVAADGNAL